ncbi:uncharacterized protein LOC126682343 [Mercurialis annua]|uniref:uncharacterized protein LOC126682343 n=1 Tax=Mercurialis annua TaxID=3986 RepID=UPI00215E681B|nr:uncharacterized protein LOC126682343 [Mercurialis annua]
MAPPHGEAITLSSKPPRLSNDSLHRTKSDMSFELSKEFAMNDVSDFKLPALPAISEVEDAKCECCGMSEECTHEYIDRIRNKFLGKWICGLCSEAVKEEMEKGGKKMEEALNIHMSACARFNKFDRAYPVLFQAEAMREMLKRSTRRTQSFPKGSQKNNSGGIARSSSCIAAITRDMNSLGN